MHLKNFDPYDFLKENVDGVDVFYKNLPWAPCINIYIVFKTGSFSDPVGKEGLSHFLEHMIFDGSSKFKDKKSIREWSKKYALNSWNAWTGLYLTAYHLKCLPENYERALSGMKNMIFYPLLKKNDVEHERGVITQEAWKKFKNDKFISYIKEVADNLFYGHNFSRVQSALGWPNTIADISLKDLKNWHMTKYAKGNFFVVLTGAVDRKNLESLKTFVDKLPYKIFDEYLRGKVQKPKKPKIVKTSSEIGDPKEQAEVTIYRSLGFLPEKLVSTANFFRAIMSDLLNERLRLEKGLCYGVEVRSFLDNDFTEIFMNIKTDESNIDVVQKEFWKILKDLENGKYKNKFKLLKKVSLEQMKSQEIMSVDVAENAVRDIIKYGRPIPLFVKLDRMEEVSYANIVKFAKEIFQPELTYTEIILPSR